MKSKVFQFAALALLVLCACSKDSANSGSILPDPMGGGVGSGTASGVEASIGTLTSFDVAVDSTALAETEVVDPTDEDYIENNTFDQTVDIVFSGNSASVSGTGSGVSATVNGAHVTVTSTVKARYRLSGTSTNGSVKFYGDKKQAIELNGLTLHNPTGAALNNQCKKRAYVVVADGTFNQLSDGATYTTTDGEDMKGAFFSEGKLLFSGTGRLRVYGSCKAGISCDDYVLLRPGANVYVKTTVGNGIKTNDAILIRGGVLNVESTGDGAKALSTDGYLQMDGGRVSLLTSGNSEWDSADNDLSSAAGVKTDSICVINDGTLSVKSTGKGGKGISADEAITINGGTISVVTTGTRQTQNSAKTSPKGIKSDSNITINGGHVRVRTTGGEGSEGIESKASLTINGGVVESYAYDDAFNAKSALTIKGGSVFAYASHDDGIDSNGSLTLAGGTVVACGTTAPEDGFDCDQNRFVITGGTVLGIGGGSSSPTSSVCTQPVVVIGNRSFSSGTYVALSGASSVAYAFRMPRQYSGCTLLMSSPALSKGSVCTVTSGVGVSGGTDFDGLVTGATVSGGSSLFSTTLSAMLTVSGSTGGQQGGQPGGPGF